MLKLNNNENQNYTDKNVEYENKKEESTAEDSKENMDLETFQETLEDSITHEKIGYAVGLYQGIGGIIVSVIICGFILIFMSKIPGIFGIIILSPFLIVGIESLIISILRTIKVVNNKKYINGQIDIEKEEQLQKKYNKVEFLANSMHVFASSFFIFMFAIIWDIAAINSWNDGGDIKFYISFAFWALGIFVTISGIKNINKK